MKNTMKFAVFAAAAALAAPAVQAADVVAFNSSPADGWFFGSGNNYAPSNTAVLTTDANQQIYLRLHQNMVVAPASDASGVYSFALGTQPLNFDWGVDVNQSMNLLNYRGTSALITMTNIGTGATASYNPYAWIPYGYDNAFGSGAVQNSARLDWFSALGFDSAIDNTYEINLTVTGLTGGTKSLSVFAQFGAGAGAVPEPASWALMMLGLGIVGASMRRRRTTVSFA